MPATDSAAGISVYYETHGDGPPLILLSGTGHDCNFWSGSCRFLRRPIPSSPSTTGASGGPSCQITTTASPTWRTMPPRCWRPRVSPPHM